MLFWDEQLSSDNTVSCGTCHQPFKATTDPRHAVHPGHDLLFGTEDDVFGSKGIVRQDGNGTPIEDPLFGFNVQVTPRTTPTILGSLWAPLLLWDGRAGPNFVDPQTSEIVIPSGGALETQALLPLLSDREMGHVGRAWTDVIAKVQSSVPMALATYLPPDMASAITSNPTYNQLFATAFGDPAVNPRRIALAIATYERTLVADQTPFDLGTLTPQQQAGFNAAFGGCDQCHVPPLFSNNTFQNVGVRPIVEDPGRQTITGLTSDAGRFKVPSLRGVGLKSTFMHNGSRSTITEVVDFYTRRNGEVQFPENQDPIVPLFQHMPDDRRLNLIAFLQGGLDDPRVAAETFPFDRPILASERGDADRDGDVDSDDRTQFEICFTGQGQGPVIGGCRRLDMDGDGDIACDDWNAFKASWTADVPPDEFIKCHIPPVPTVSQWGGMTMILTILIAGTSTIRKRTADLPIQS